MNEITCFVNCQKPNPCSSRSIDHRRAQNDEKLNYLITSDYRAISQMVPYSLKCTTLGQSHMGIGCHLGRSLEYFRVTDDC